MIIPKQTTNGFNDSISKILNAAYILHSYILFCDEELGKTNALRSKASQDRLKRQFYDAECAYMDLIRCVDRVKRISDTREGFDHSEIIKYGGEEGDKHHSDSCTEKTRS